MFRYILVVTALVASGCQSNQPSRAERQAIADAEQDQKCRSFGARPGTSDYIRCRETLYAQARNDDAQRQAFALSMLNRQQPLSTPRAVNCTSMRNGVLTNTTCY